MTFTLEIEQTSSQDPVPEGMYLARITHVAMLGKHPETYEGRTKVKIKIGITYEIVDNIRQAKGAPWILPEAYNYSTYSKSRLHPVLKATISTFGKQPKVDLKEMLDKPVSITVVQNSKNSTIYSNVEKVEAVSADIDVPGATSEILAFDPENFNDEIFLKLPRRFRKMISERIIEPEPEGDSDQDVPY